MDEAQKQHDEKHNKLWKGAKAEAKAMDDLIQQELWVVAFERLRTRMGIWNKKDRDAFMSELPAEHHNLAFAAAVGEDYSAEWHKPVAPSMYPINAKDRKEMSKSRPEMYAWLWGDGGFPKAMNCWETILVAAYKANKLTKEQIKGLVVSRRGEPVNLINHIKKTGRNYLSQGAREFTQKDRENIIRGNRPTHEAYQEMPLKKLYEKVSMSYEEYSSMVHGQIKAGDIIMFGNKAEHVAVCVSPGHLMEVDGMEGRSDVRFGSIWVSMKRKKSGSYAYSIWWAKPEALFDYVPENPPSKKKKKESAPIPQQIGPDNPYAMEMEYLHISKPQVNSPTMAAQNEENTSKISQYLIDRWIRYTAATTVITISVCRTSDRLILLFATMELKKSFR